MGNPVPISFSEAEYTRTTEKLGSNPGGFFRKKSDGKEYYVKWLPEGERGTRYEDRSRNRFNNEFLAIKLYELFGVAVPKSDFITFRDATGKTCYGIISEKQEGLRMIKEVPKSGPININTIRPLAQQDFLIDALLSNYDVVGSGGNNLHYNKTSGEVLRIDAGGALKYLAQGVPKKGAFNAAAHEFDDFASGENTKTGFHKGALKNAGIVFSGVHGSPALTIGLAKLKSVTDEQIKACVLTHGWDETTPKGHNKNEALIATLLARKHALISKAEATLTIGEAAKIESARTGGAASTELKGRLGALKDEEKTPSTAPKA